MPLFLVTICYCLDIGLLKFLKYSGVICWYQTFFSSSNRVGYLDKESSFQTCFFFILCLQFSIAFKSVQSSGQSRTYNYVVFQESEYFVTLRQGALAYRAWTLQHHESVRTSTCDPSKLYFSHVILSLLFLMKNAKDGSNCSDNLWISTH